MEERDLLHYALVVVEQKVKDVPSIISFTSVDNKNYMKEAIFLKSAMNNYDDLYTNNHYLIAAKSVYQLLTRYINFAKRPLRNFYKFCLPSTKTLTSYVFFSY